MIQKKHSILIFRQFKKPSLMYKNYINKELEKLEEIKETKAEENKAEIGLDELYNERKELIENYVNKVYAMEEYQKLRPKLDNETKEELEKYKLKNIGKSNLFLESDSEAELEVIKTEIKKKKFENIKTKGNTDCKDDRLTHN